MNAKALPSAVLRIFSKTLNPKPKPYRPRRVSTEMFGLRLVWSHGNDRQWAAKCQLKTQLLVGSETEQMEQVWPEYARPTSLRQPAVIRFHVPPLCSSVAEMPLATTQDLQAVSHAIIFADAPWVLQALAKGS